VQATDAARALDARAFTVGQHVVFGAGQYAPQQIEGQRLLAHELTHVLQQRGEPTGGRRAVAGAAIQRAGDDTTGASGEVDFEEPAAVTAVRYPYTRHCGVVDWSHAGEEMASLAKNLVDTVRWASDAFDKYEIDADGTIRFGGQTVIMATDEYYVSPVLQLNRKLTEQEIEGVALTLFMILSVKFEELQGSGLLGQAISFSGEDLPSNLIGFYHGLRGYNREEIERICEVMPAEEAQSSFKLGGKDVALWMENNRTFRPTQYPPGGSWPAEFNTVKPIQPSSQVWDLVGVTLRWEELGITGVVSKRAYETGQEVMSQCRFQNDQVLCR
jgi:Domain of unknown function (DUF4157)